jgi:arylsulfatase A-like enzyme
MSRLLSILALAFAVEAAASSLPQNLLFILTDNQPASILGAYGNTEVRTPNIDRLASEGMKFTNAFAANGMCSPTRATLMTGLMPSQHGVHNWLDDSMLENWPKNWSAIGEYRTLPLTLANRGYETGMIGKWHLGQPWKPAVGYQHWITFTDGHTVDFWRNTVIENGKVYDLIGIHTVDFFADKAVEFLAAERDKPFYLQLNLNGPYLNPPSNLGPAKNRHYESYDDTEFTSFPREAFNSNVAHQLTDEKTPPFLIKKHLEAIEMHNDRNTMANVASQNTMVDDAVGKVLKALEDNGLAESTLVVFSSDQGNFYGHHGLWQHTVVTTPANLYEQAMNIPLIIRHTGSVKAGQTNDNLIGQYDLPVTLLDYLGVNDVSLENSPGRSFSAQLKGDSGEWENIVFYEQEETRGVRTERFAYWERLKGTGDAELYNLEADPSQYSNVVSDEQYAQKISQLKELMTTFFDQYNDPKYDLWKGGIAKGSVIRVNMFQELYGPDWSPKTELVEPFQE